MSAAPIVALIGRPNVGKSTLFNRLISGRHAITFDRPGVTRDRQYQLTDLWLTKSEKLPYIIMDTGGFYQEKVKTPELFESNGEKSQRTRQDEIMAVFFNTMMEHAEMAMQEADLILLVVDAKEGVVELDKEIAKAIRKRQKNFLLVVNKVDSEKQEQAIFEFTRLGVDTDQILSLSACHGRGIDDLEQRLGVELQRISGKTELTFLQPKNRVLGNITILGAPNAGKSTLINTLLGEERSLVTPVAGTTIDPVEGFFDGVVGDEAISVRVIDTAGMRRKARIDDPLEQMSVSKSLQSMELSDLVVLMVDAGIGVTHQDRRLAELCLEKGKSLVIVLNKVDLYPEILGNEKKRKLYLDQVKKEIPWDYCQVIPCSAKDGAGLIQLKKQIFRTLNLRQGKIATGKLNRILQSAVELRPLIVKGTHRRFQVKYATTIKMSPPTIIIFSNMVRDIPEHYRRFLSNTIRREFRLDNFPIHLIFRKKTREDQFDTQTT